MPAFRSLLRLAFAAAAIFEMSEKPGASAAPAPEENRALSGVHGKLVVKGKSLEFERAWLVRGPDSGDDTKPAAYILLSSHDLTSEIEACKDVGCAVFDVVKEGAILEPIDDAEGSFWLRVVAPGLPHREEQISGRTWTASLDRRERLSGRLHFLYSNTRDEADLEIDAKLAKEFPVRKRPS